MRLEHLAALTALVVGLVACGSETTPGESEGETDSALSNDNDRTAFFYFVDKGLTKTQAAAIVGNLDQESTMNPKAKQLPSGPGRGIAQWSVNDRWAQENAFAKQQGADPVALQTQLDFVWHELTTVTRYGLAQLKAATTMSSAVEIFQDKYEICGKCAAGSRLTFANNALKAFGNQAPDPPATQDDPEAAAPPTGDDDDVTFSDAIAQCTAGGVSGGCVSTTECANAGGTSTPGVCPGAKNIQCCTF
jgi:hypothetical protein